MLRRLLHTIHSSWKNKGMQECAYFKSALRFKKVPLTTDDNISLRARFCSPANIVTCITLENSPKKARALIG